MTLEVGKVYLFYFPKRGMREFFGKHYGVVLSKISSDDKTLLVAPITGKKNGRKYRGGVTLENTKYQSNPSYEKSFIYVRKIQELDKRRAFGERKIKLNEEGEALLDRNGNKIHYIEHEPVFQLDNEDLERLQKKIDEIINLRQDDSLD